MKIRGYRGDANRRAGGVGERNEMEAPRDASSSERGAGLGV
jgi:hypothetical protein